MELNGALDEYGVQTVIGAWIARDVVRVGPALNDYDPQRDSPGLGDLVGLVAELEGPDTAAVSYQGRQGLGR